MEHLGANEEAKSSTCKYGCYKCNYFTSRKCNYEKHLLTAKHIKRETEVKCPHKCSCGKVFTRIDNLNRHKNRCNNEQISKAKVLKVAEVAKMLPNAPKLLVCECGTSFTRSSNLKRHKKTCKHINKEISKSDNEISSSRVLKMFGSLNEKLDRTCKDNEILNAKLDKTCEDNQILKEDNKILKEEIKQLKSGVMTAVSEPKTINNYNNNIIFLLNEKCGDAVAIKDFAKQIAMCLDDVDFAMENGKVKGIENIIRKKFEELGTFKRPLHCTDVKRGTLYVKNEEGWGKEKGEIKKMIRDVECVQTKGITVWSDANPEYSEGNTKLMDKWLKIVKCLTGSIDGIGMRKIEKRCQEMCKIDHDIIN
jgi:cell division protein FtsB